MNRIHDPAKKSVTLIPGDGIGPEVIQATRRIVDAAGARIEWEECEAGARVFAKGLETGVAPETIDSIHRTRVALKGPLETQAGSGGKSANVTLRKMFETYGNIRPVRGMPNVPAPFGGEDVDIVVVRENVEDLYAAIEHMQTPGVAQGLKLITRKGSEKIIRLAFEFARAEGRKLVHCATKANIMKLTEGLFKRVFEDVAREYPDIEARHIIVDNCAHKLIMKPRDFDIIVTTNMNGDILSDLSSALVGGLGFAPSANIGNEVALFEAVHGTAPDIAGQDIANPTALILSAVMMLRHLGEFEPAARIENALFYTLEEGRALTRDVAGARGVGTRAFTDEVIANLGRDAKSCVRREYHPIRLPQVSRDPVLVKASQRAETGVDVFIESGLDTEQLGKSLERLCEDSPLRLKMISNRGTKVYPPSRALSDCVDQWRCRFIPRNGEALDDAGPAILDLLRRLQGHHRWMHIEKLQEFDGVPGFTKAQGEE